MRAAAALEPPENGISVDGIRSADTSKLQMGMENWYGAVLVFFLLALLCKLQ
jgi:hypothetical protein